MTKNLRQKDKIFKTLNLTFRRDWSEGLSRIDPVSYIFMSALQPDGMCKYSSLKGREYSASDVLVGGIRTLPHIIPLSDCRCYLESDTPDTYLYAIEKR